MVACPKCGQFNYVDGICLNNNCKFPQMKSNNEIQRERQRSQEERRRRDERHRDEDLDRKEEQKRQKDEQRRARGKSKTNTRTDDWLDGLILLSGVAGIGYLGYMTNPEEPLMAVIWGGFGLAVAHGLRKLIRTLIYIAF